MAIRIASVSNTWSKDVFTDRGQYCGKIEDVECDLKRFKLRSLIVRAVKGSYISKMLGSKKGLIIPFTMVEAIGDIVLIKHISTPVGEETTELPKEEEAKEGAAA
ncbi:MAG: PRC-barrel domain-containing protein [Candidatus Aenigmatarchaeota archaeon]|nr:MAG: PRC-barrel domain-containing protein [Candidatus Aenigmarchaeota archaeon]